MDQSKKMARIAYNALSDKKGEDIKIIDITGISVLADYFLIANGNSDSQGKRSCGQCGRGTSQGRLPAAPERGAGIRKLGAA